MNKKQQRLLIRILIAAVCFIPLFFIAEEILPWALPKWAILLLFLIPYLTVGYDILRKAAYGIKNKQVFDENFLMSIATIAAIALGKYTEGVAVMLLYQVGELFQSYAVGKSRKNISELMDIRPDYANIETDGCLEQVDPEDVATGSLIVVRAGEKVPLDGCVEEGTSSLNTAALTGESAPVDVAKGDLIYSGSINLTGVLKIRTTTDFAESTASKILDLVENASSRKSKSEHFISKFARIYTPIVCICAALLAVVPPLFVMLSGIGAAAYPTWGALWRDWVIRACAFLVISCPCAVVISVPLSFFAGIGGAGKQGILIKGSNYLELLSKVRLVALDKTGTVTKGNFEVSALHHGLEKEKKEAHEKQMLLYAALAECRSSHPISISLQQAYAGKLDERRVGDVQEVSGHGIIAQVDDKTVIIGNEKMMEREGILYHPCTHTGSIIHMAVDGAYWGHIVISDQVKATSKEAMLALQKDGIEKVVLLTGDTQKVAKKVAEEIGIADYRAELLPADKVAEVETLLAAKPRHKKLAFVGDGINDAPVLARADIGIAMGALGSDAAIEAADVVLMDDDPRKIAKAIRISRKCLRIVRQNIILALAVKAACLILSLLGIADMWIAIGADVGVMVLAVLNAIRCMFVKNLS